MRIIVLILLLLFPLSCSTVTNIKYQLELSSFVRSFEKQCNCTVDVPITIEKIPSNEPGYTTLGLCYAFRWPKVFRSIKIDVDYWQKANFYQKESTVFHELAHCVLDLEHTDEMTGEYLWIRPKSIMYPYSFPQYETYRKQYWKELFSRKPGPYKK